MRGAKAPRLHKINKDEEAEKQRNHHQDRLSKSRGPQRLWKEPPIDKHDMECRKCQNEAGSVCGNKNQSDGLSQSQRHATPEYGGNEQPVVKLAHVIADCVTEARESRPKN